MGRTILFQAYGILIIYTNLNFMNKVIAVPMRNDQEIDDHFGHCEMYGIYEITESNEIRFREFLPSVNGCGCKSNIASVLAGKGVSVMLAGGIGEGAINVLGSYGIEVIRGCHGQALPIVEGYRNGTLVSSGDICHSHDHDHGHACNH